MWIVLARLRRGRGPSFCPRGSARGGRVCASRSRAAAAAAADNRSAPLPATSRAILASLAHPLVPRSPRRPLCPPPTRATASLDDPFSLPPLPPPLLPFCSLSRSESRCWILDRVLPYACLVNRECVNVKGDTKQCR